MAVTLYIFALFEHIGTLFIFKNIHFNPSLTLFCYVYNFFLMFLIDFYLRNSNPMSASLKNLGIFFHIQGQRSISRSNMIFQQMKRGTSEIPQFYEILNGLSIFEIILITQGHLQDQKVNFKVKWKEISFLLRKVRNMCSTSFSVHFLPF